MGHGGRSESRNPAGLAMARRFVRRHGIAVAAIDAIEHGDRGPLTGADEAPYAELWKRPDTFDRMVADWQATLDAVTALPEVDAGRRGVLGALDGHDAGAAVRGGGGRGSRPRCWGCADSPGRALCAGGSARGIARTRRASGAR